MEEIKMMAVPSPSFRRAAACSIPSRPSIIPSSRRVWNRPLPGFFCQKQARSPGPIREGSYFINFRQDLDSSSRVEQGAIWHREDMVRMLAI